MTSRLLASSALNSAVSPLLRNDLALLKLDKSPIMSDSVGVACLPEAGDVPAHGTPCYISGWGNLYSNASPLFNEMQNLQPSARHSRLSRSAPAHGPMPDRLQQAPLPVVEHAVCSRSDWWGSFVKTTMICAGGDLVSGCNVREDAPTETPGSQPVDSALPLKVTSLLFFSPLRSGGLRGAPELPGCRRQVVRSGRHQFRFLAELQRSEEAHRLHPHLGLQGLAQPGEFVGGRSVHARRHGRRRFTAIVSSQVMLRY